MKKKIIFYLTVAILYSCTQQKINQGNSALKTVYVGNYSFVISNGFNLYFHTNDSINGVIDFSGTEIDFVTGDIPVELYDTLLSYSPKNVLHTDTVGNYITIIVQEKTDTIYSMYFLMCNIDSKNTLFNDERMDGISINAQKIEANQRKKIISLFESVKHK